MFARELHHAGHTKRFVVRSAAEHGWEVREEQDSTVVRLVCYSDWHRVERAMQAIAVRIGELENRGWSPEYQDTCATPQLPTSQE